MVGFEITNQWKIEIEKKKKRTWSASELFITPVPPKIISFKVFEGKETSYFTTKYI